MGPPLSLAPFASLMHQDQALCLSMEQWSFLNPWGLLVCLSVTLLPTEWVWPWPNQQAWSKLASADRLIVSIYKKHLHTCHIQACFPEVSVWKPNCLTCTGRTRTGSPRQGVTVDARKLEHDRPPTSNQRKKDNQHKLPYSHVPTFWSLLQMPERPARAFNLTSRTGTTHTRRCQIQSQHPRPQTSPLKP